mmetsp:Transcript_599/g.817  ORF Transcript_599/g.817 Transcript_599/m.817 type:complete len:390 (-) Transcript_599:104-1273(-)|eukprot:CAMPEP_0194046748 /NCGR_PEP_ID=MMETSP0009_2-20130614/22278_1 /TAXON_ID=210454 /ORGANISM="Grammatophora oceanica, Strain CCMP 410" /LENGTH=389 /DNA_ID=CAMNT_0038692155 /DNA_START=249 /DNA_END=1418 /DNA_ORIENTATION=-
MWSTTVERRPSVTITTTNKANNFSISRIARTTTLLILLLQQCIVETAGWGSDGTNYDETSYMNGRTWASDGSSLSIKVDGCAWGLTDEGENAACMEQSSEDGTTYWYQMVNCLRAQVVFSVYSGSSGTCNSNTYQETFMAPLSDFIGYMQSYDPYCPFAQDAADNGDDDAGGGGGGDDDFDAENMPICEGNDSYYYGVVCSDTSFAIGAFSDQYCFEYEQTIVDSLDSINYNMKTYTKGCQALNNDGDGNSFGEVAVPYLMPCSSLDSGVCTDGASFTSREGGTSQSNRFHIGTKKSGTSWGTKLKYAVGALLLLGAFILFTGILFTNRRRRRALIQRKYRASRRDRKSSRSTRSKSRSDRTTRSSRSRRSKSRSRAVRNSEADEGVFT